MYWLKFPLIILTFCVYIKEQLCSCDVFKDTSWPFNAQEVSLWRVKSSGVRQSKIYKGNKGLEEEFFK